MINISNEVRMLATKCTKKHSCLCGESDFCGVEKCVNNAVLFIKCKQNASCPYQIFFGNDFICSCPVRKAIYDKYKI